MRIAHAKLIEEISLNDSHVDAVVEILGATLKGTGMAPAAVVFFASG